MRTITTPLLGVVIMVITVWVTGFIACTQSL